MYLGYVTQVVQPLINYIISNLVMLQQQQTNQMYNMTLLQITD